MSGGELSGILPVSTNFSKSIGAMVAVAGATERLAGGSSAPVRSPVNGSTRTDTCFGAAAVSLLMEKETLTAIPGASRRRLVIPKEPGASGAGGAAARLE